MRILYPKLCNMVHALRVCSLLSNELAFAFLFAITAAGVWPCGGTKKSPRTSSIVHITFFVWSFEISGIILRIQKLVLCLEPYSRRHFAFYSYCKIEKKVFKIDCPKINPLNCSIISWRSFPVY